MTLAVGSMRVTKLRVGVMGCSTVAQRLMLPALVDHPEAELVAVASRSADKAAAFSVEFACRPVTGYAALLDRDEVDVVYMPLPTGLHEEWALKALQAGKHLLVEKSLAPSLLVADRIVDTARLHRRLVRENFLFLHHSQFSWILEQLASGDIGRLRLVRATFGFPPLSRDNFRYDRGLGGGALLDVGAYGIRMALALGGCSWQVCGVSRVEDEALGVDVYGTLQLLNPEGVAVQAAYGFNYVYQCSLELLGTSGRLTAERIFTPPPGFSPRVWVEKQGRRTEHQLPPDNHCRNAWTAFAQCVRANEFDESLREVRDQACLLDDVRRIGEQGAVVRRGLLDR